MNRKQKLLLSIMKIGLMELGKKLDRHQIYNKCDDIINLFDIELDPNEVDIVINALYQWLQTK